MSNEFGFYPRTGWKGLVRKEQGILTKFMTGLRRFMDEVCR